MMTVMAMNSENNWNRTHFCKSTIKESGIYAMQEIEARMLDPQYFLGALRVSRTAA
jgi:hypothetical protein